MENNKNVNAAALMKNVCEAAFYVTDLKLYLDTHSDDKEAIEVYLEACRRCKACVEAFEKHCYPLFAVSADCECGWEWLVGAWPPEKLV